METWKEYRIKDLGEVITGNTPPTSNREYYGTEYKFIKPTDMVEGQRFVPTTEEFYSNLAYEKYKRCLLPPKTPCVVTIGSLGKKMCLTDTYCFTNQAVNAVIPNKDNDGEFLYYAFKASVLAYVKQLDSGTTSGRENVSKSSFSNIKVKVPSLTTQKKIASILSTYDNLIQNYKKQIEDLQTSASELYKEWFIRFRFPGYKTTQFENGIPVGWKVETANRLCEISIGKTPPRAEQEWFSYDDKDIQWVSISDMNQGIYIQDTQEKLTKAAVKKFNIIIVPKDTVLLSFKLTVGKVSITKTNCCTNEAIAHFRIKNLSLREYLYFFLSNFPYQKLGNTSAIGTAVNSQIVKKMKLVIPSNELLNKYHSFAGPIFDKINYIGQQITNLTQQRDLLLPRLMSGKLEI